MVKYKQIYIDYFDYDVGEFIPCEVCHAPAQEIHHIQRKGMGGSKTKDYIENLMALCRRCHDKFGDRNDAKEFLRKIHYEKIGYKTT